MDKAMIKKVGRLLGVAVCALLIWGGCDKTEQAPPQEQGAYKTGVSNPVVEVKDASAFTALGLKLEAPKEGTDTKYFIIANELAEVDFIYHKQVYCYRAATTQEDISGVYDRQAGKSDAISIQAAGGDTTTMTVRRFEGGGAVASWKWGGVAFSLFARQCVNYDEFCTFARSVAAASHQ